MTRPQKKQQRMDGWIALRLNRSLQTWRGVHFKFALKSFLFSGKKTKTKHNWPARRVAWAQHIKDAINRRMKRAHFTSCRKSTACANAHANVHSGRHDRDLFKFTNWLELYLARKRIILPPPLHPPAGPAEHRLLSQSKFFGWFAEL